MIHTSYIDPEDYQARQAVREQWADERADIAADERRIAQIAIREARRRRAEHRAARLSQLDAQR